MCQLLCELWPELDELLRTEPPLLSNRPGIHAAQEPRRIVSPRGPRWYLLTQELQEAGRLILLTDVTSLQDSRQALETANLGLSRSNTDLEHYAFVASHDLQ